MSIWTVILGDERQGSSGEVLAMVHQRLVSTSPGEGLADDPATWELIFELDGSKDRKTDRKLNCNLL